MKRRFKSFNEVKGYTSIDLTSKSIDDIYDYIDEYRKNNGDCEINFPFKEGVIIRSLNLQNEELEKYVKDVLSYYYFKIEEDDDKFKIIVEVYQGCKMLGNHVFVGQCAMKLNINENSSVTNVTPLDYEVEIDGKLSGILGNLRQNISKDKNSLLREMGYVLTSLLYIDIVRNNRQIIYKKAKGMTFKSSTKKVKSTKTEKVEVLNGEKVMYVINGSESNIKGFRNYTRRADSWNVIGHWRHYKSGLIKWIDGYKKGDGKAKAKRYKIK